MILVTLNAARRTKERWPLATHWTISAEGVLRLWLTKHVGEEIAAYAPGVWHHVEHGADAAAEAAPATGNSIRVGSLGMVNVSAGEAIR